MLKHYLLDCFYRRGQKYEHTVEAWLASKRLSISIDSRYQIDLFHFINLVIVEVAIVEPFLS